MMDCQISRCSLCWTIRQEAESLPDSQDQHQEEDVLVKIELEQSPEFDPILATAAGIKIKQNYKTVDAEIVDKSSRVVFILSKLFDIPKVKCGLFLRKHGHPSGWVNVCDNCSSLVDQGLKLFLQIQKMNQDFTEIKSKLGDIVVGSEIEKLGEGDDDKIISPDAEDDIRAYILKFHYGEENSTSRGEKTREIEMNISERDDNSEISSDVSEYRVRTRAKHRGRGLSLRSTKAVDAKRELRPRKRMQRETVNLSDDDGDEDDDDDEVKVKNIEILPKVIIEENEWEPGNDEDEEMESDEGQVSHDDDSGDDWGPSSKRKKSDAKTVFSKKSKFICCGKSWKDNYGLQRHRRQFHKSSKILPELIEIVSSSFKCPFCDESFLNKKNLNDHTKMVHERSQSANAPAPEKLDTEGSEDELEAKKPSTSNKKTIKKKSSKKNKSVTCIICSKVLKDKYILKKHMTVHGTGLFNAPFLCQVCGSRFRRKDGLERHRDSKCQTNDSGDELEEKETETKDSKKVPKKKKFIEKFVSESETESESDDEEGEGSWDSDESAKLRRINKEYEKQFQHLVESDDDSD